MEMWLCKNCGLLNYLSSMRCVACFDINVVIPKAEIGDERLLHYVDQNRWDHPFKMIEFNGKLYLMTINHKSDVSIF